MVLILSVSLLALTSTASAIRDGNVAAQRLQAAQVLAAVLRTGGCGSTSTTTALSTTYHVTVSPSSCSAGASETGLVTWTASGQANQLTMSSVAPPSTGTGAYAVTT
jgi:Tfp pilus assembly protein PilV